MRPEMGAMCPHHQRGVFLLAASNERQPIGALGSDRFSSSYKQEMRRPASTCCCNWSFQATCDQNSTKSKKKTFLKEETSQAGKKGDQLWQGCWEQCWFFFPIQELLARSCVHAVLLYSQW